MTSNEVRSWSTELLCELAEGVGKITLLFSEVGGNYIDGALSLCVYGESPVTVNYPLHLSGFHIARFRTELSNCYKDLDWFRPANGLVWHGSALYDSIWPQGKSCSWRQSG